MIISKDVKIKIPSELSSEYIENELKNLGFDIQNVLKWAITDYDNTYYTINIAIVINNTQKNYL